MLKTSRQNICALNSRKIHLQPLRT